MVKGICSQGIFRGKAKFLIFLLQAFEESVGRFARGSE
jgi:hypothetical protein